MKFFITGLSLLVLTGCSSVDQIEPDPVLETPGDIVVTASEIITDTIDMPETEVVIVEPEPVCQIFDDFSGTKNIGWQRVNDNVMGGRSEGQYEFVDQTMVLSGSINLNGGGFTSVRAPLPNGILQDFDSVTVTAKSDGRGYQLTFQDRNRQRLSHRLGLNLSASDDWQEVTINFADLEPAFFGRLVEAAGFDKSQAREIGFILNDGLGGDYQLEIKEVKFCAA